MNDLVDALYPAWHAAARCNGMDPAIWFPDTPRSGGFTREHAAAQALAICGRCPVATECRADGAGEPFGIWGGIDNEAKDETT